MLMFELEYVFFLSFPTKDRPTNRHGRREVILAISLISYLQYLETIRFAAEKLEREITDPSSDMYRLYLYLMNQFPVYDETRDNNGAIPLAVRPGNPINVIADLKVLDVMEVDVYAQSMSVDVEMRFRWKDPLMVWDPEKYGGIR